MVHIECSMPSRRGQQMYLIVIFFIGEVTHALNGFWTHGLTPNLLLQGEKIPFEL